MIFKKIEKNKKWFRLDNAAKIYPAIITGRMTTVFRISATMKEIVSSAVLQKALDNTIVRFPYYKVKLRAGFFWHYLQENQQNPEVKIETEHPCRKINRISNRKFLFRVLVYHKRQFHCTLPRNLDVDDRLLFSF